MTVFCSFIVEAPAVMRVPGYCIVLDRGRNVFNASVPDVQTFQDNLEALGCKVVKVNRLDDFDPLEPLALDA